MVIHVLNGDALRQTMEHVGLQGRFVVMKECLIEGDVNGSTLSEVYASRARYLSQTYNVSTDEYKDQVAAEIDKLTAVTEDTQINLWFGYDLFCQVNLWFLLWVLKTHKSHADVFVVYPSWLAPATLWDDFGHASKDNLEFALRNKVLLSQSDIDLGSALWSAYQTSDFEQLDHLSQTQTPAFPTLATVCKAHRDRFPADGNLGRPETAVRDLIAQGSKNFSEVFRAFARTQGVYGFGDTQVKRIFDHLMDTKSKG